MYGGYELDPAARAGARGCDPAEVDGQPYWGRGKKSARTTSAAFSAPSGSRAAAAGRSARAPGSRRRRPLPALPPGPCPGSGKIDRFVGRLPGVHVLHKAGWINDARHDNGIVLWPGGAILVTVMTYRPPERE